VSETATAAPRATGRRSRGGAGLDWLHAEGAGDAGELVRAHLNALVGPPAAGEQVQSVPCDHVDRSPYQARRVFPAKDMADLLASIRANGLLQPIVLRPRPGGRFELIAGERRLRVARVLGWTTIQAVIREVDDITAHVLGQVENDDRSDISAWERALGYVDLRDHIAQVRGAVPQLAELGGLRGGVDKSTVSRYITIGGAFSPEAVLRAGLSEEEMASLNLPTLLRAARKPDAQRFTLLRDVLRKRRVRAAHAEAGADPGAADPRPRISDPCPDLADTGAHTETETWRRLYSDRPIRVETPLPAGEMSAKAAHAAAGRLVPALAALSARIAEREEPAPLLLDTPTGTLVYLPAPMADGLASALVPLRQALGL